MKNSKFFRCLAFVGLATALLGTACSGGPDKSVTFTVAFDTGGGSAVESQTVANADLATRPDDPTRNGYTFENWYQDDKYTTVFDFESVPITANWTLYANWTVNVTPDDEPVGPLSPSGSEETGAIRYVITGLPSWIQDDGCVIFAWAWAEGEQGAWYAFAYDDADRGHFDVPKEAAGFLLARCKEGTTTPNWEDKTSNDPGRVYNQSEDMTTSSGEFTYTCSTWKDYPN